MVQYVFTPWRDRRELLLVRQSFYGPSSPTPAVETRPSIGGGGQEDREDQHRAVARVSMWMQRGNCPHMVESTALLMAAVLSDEASAAATANAAASTYAVRAAYSAAFSRFVTGLLDGHQEKLRKQSMYSLAKTIGLPATFVELRHQATHEQLPSLARLRSAAQKALLWIWGYYWKHLGPAPAAAKTGGGEDYRELVMAYLREDDDGESARMVARMRKGGDLGAVLRTVGELQETLPGNKAFLKCLKLSRELMEAKSAEEVEEEGEDGGEEGARHGEEGPEEEEEEEEEEEDVVKEGQDDGADEEEPDPSEDMGWSSYSSGVWIPKPIGVV